MELAEVIWSDFDDYVYLAQLVSGQNELQFRFQSGKFCLAMQRLGSTLRSVRNLSKSVVIRIAPSHFTVEPWDCI